MDRLSPQHVPFYETSEKRKQLWQRCLDDRRPVVAVRDASRGFIVRYDLQHLETELTPSALGTLRRRTRDHRRYPTSGSGDDTAGADPVSETEGIGGEAGPVSGDLHAESEDVARELASRLSGIVFDRTNWK